MTRIQHTSSTESKHLIHDFLNERSSGVLVTVDSASHPHLAVTYYVPEDGFSVLFVTKMGTQKFRDIQTNNNVAFMIYDEALQIALQLSGKVEPVYEEGSRRTALLNMAEKSASLSKRGTPPLEKLIAGDYVTLRIVPEIIKMAIYARSDYDGDDMFEAITFNASEI